MIRTCDTSSIALAVERLRDGQLVGAPTETVYGLAADASNDEAVAKVFALKGRPRFNPLIIHVADPAQAEALVEPSDSFTALAGAFWPGPLSLVAKQRKHAPISALATAGLDTIAVRAPSHPAARALITAFGRPLAMPSANPSGRLSPTTASDVARDFGGRLELVLDGGPATAGVESTVVDTTGDSPAILRSGALDRARLEAAVGPVSIAGQREADAPLSPGMLVKHYAPARARLRLNAERPRSGEAYLGFGPAPFADLNLSARGDVNEAAANLFRFLRALDGAGYARIAIAPIPNLGLGEAINDRLFRAAET